MEDNNIQEYPIGPFDIWVWILAALIIIIPFWRIFSKAGYSGWLSLLTVIPVVNLIAWYFLAFSNWPILKTKESNQGPLPPSSTE